MAVIGAREANRSFSKILKEAENGTAVTITRNGNPVARLIPIPKKQWKSEKERQAAIKRMVETMERGMHLGGKGATRDEMHER